MKLAVTWQMCGYVDIDADTMEEALDAIYQNVENYTMEEIEQEFDDNNCFESGKARYTIFKYVD